MCNTFVGFALGTYLATWFSATFAAAMSFAFIGWNYGTFGASWFNTP
jgi:hypothetical protein